LEGEEIVERGLFVESPEPGPRRGAGRLAGRSPACSVFREPSTSTAGVLPAVCFVRRPQADEGDAAWPAQCWAWWLWA
jgi:hypothetical protein